MKAPQTKSKIKVPAHLLAEDRQLPLVPHIREGGSSLGGVSAMGLLLLLLSRFSRVQLCVTP